MVKITSCPPFLPSSLTGVFQVLGGFSYSTVYRCVRPCFPLFLKFGEEDEEGVDVWGIVVLGRLKGRAQVSYVLYGVWYVSCGVVGVVSSMLKRSFREFRGAVL